MKGILEKYSTRLINISGRNSSLVTKKLYKKRAFDIVKLDKFNNGLSNDVIKFLCRRKDGPLEILEDSYNWYAQKYEKLKEMIEKDKKKAIEKLKSSGKEYTNEDLHAIKNKYNQKLIEEDDKLKKFREEILSYSDNIKVLVKEIKNIERETGRYELFIGYPFVEGYFKDGTFTRAPLLLFPIEVVKIGGKWAIVNKIDSPVILNKVFLIGYAKYNEEKLADIDTEYDDLSLFGMNIINGVLEKLKKENIYITYNEKKIHTFKDITIETQPIYNLGELKIKNNIVMGHFNIANSIYKDYQEMESMELSNDLMRKLLKDEDIKGLGDISNSRSITCNDIKEKEFYFISALDYSQEIAVMRSIQNSELVIYGPPGTGKSQTIVNIISQYLGQGKKVLMVSQKKAALDVIFNRASSINSKMIMFNKEIDKKLLYSRIANRILSLRGGSLNNKSIDSMSNIIDENVEKLNTLSDILTKKSSFGLTIQEMYNKQRINKENEILNKFFRKFRKSFPFKQYTYDDLVSIKNVLLSNEKALKFYKLKHIMGDNTYCLFIKDNIDIYDLEDAIEDVKNLINDYKIIITNLMDEVKYFEESKKVVNNNLSIETIAKKIVEDENTYLLEKFTSGSKFSVMYWINLKKNKAKEEENLNIFNNKVKDIIAIIESEVDKINKVIEYFKFLNNVLIMDEVNKLTIRFDDTEAIIRNLKLILDVLERYDEISSLRCTVSDIKEREINFLEGIYSIEKDYEKAHIILENIHLLANQIYIGQLQREYAEELENIDNYKSLTKEASNAIDKKRRAIPKYINQKWDNTAINSKKKNEKLWKSMIRECNKKSKVLQIREFTAKFQDVIFDLYPCWLLSPESVSEILPLIEGLFDIIIFDEASQMFIESAIPSIYRGKKVVVAGDDKQLRPSSMFNSKFDEEEDEYDIEIEAALEEESLLDLAKYNFDSTSLYYHYRSHYDELINFSNYAFYGGRLEVSPNILKCEISEEKPIERIKVDGKWSDRRNPIEAEEVVRLVKDILNNRKNDETIGIITFNITQRDLIDNLLEIEAAKDPEFANNYYSEIERIQDNEDKSLFIKNIENVQGDERDIIIFSTAYAKNEKGKVVTSFGSLSQDGGENRLNVAISRAKDKIYVVTSIEPEDLNVDSSRNNGPKLFKKYLQYVRAVSEGNKNVEKEILYSVCDSLISRNTNIHYDSDFENQVHDALQREGLIVDTQIGVSGYKIDLGIYDNISSRYILGIECDGAAYHSSKSARERDIYRQRYLESRGWNIIRIWSRDWWNNPQKEVEKIVNKVNELLEIQKNNLKEIVLDSQLDIDK
ncbi:MULTISPECIES: AAA domain-containing protein [Clostridium]|uniref:Superfamily I DNA and/or RNA helicase n=2 Tax=Clostridium cadaveris TaxID=1529 RepID=A0A1I2MR91_9CLOT|nr:AAA domain-containing protein [Clostridium cadaveris]MDU4951862.1 AAA domain-containing protein [Clostridium sp.]SFF91997.1 Superfamily I DNA and/or RNA helicase [Clostridium cadaveris]